MTKPLLLRRLVASVSAVTMCLIGFSLSGVFSGHLFALGQKNDSNSRVPVIEDWSHRHLIYSAPRSTIQNLQLQQQPRYVQQYLRRNVLPLRPVRGPVSGPIHAHFGGSDGWERDWGIAVGNGFTMGIGNYPAKYVFNVNQAPSCTNDYVVFTTSQGAGTDIYAVNHLYVNSGGTGLCSGLTNPTVLWSYHVQSQGGVSNTSPVISFLGDQIAWVEGTGGTAALHLLKPYTGGGDGTIATPNTPPASATGAAYRSCTPSAPTGGGATSHACLLNLAFANGKDDTGAGGAITPSSPYYDYISDFALVGDDAGNLHEFTGVFIGTPAEVTTGGWPVTMTPVDTAPQLESPVYDETSGNAFLGNNSGRIFYVRLSNTSTGTCNAGSNGGVPPCVGSTTFTDGNTANTKIALAPIVDSTTQRLFVFFSPAGGGPGAEVGQDDTTLSAANQVVVNVGSGTAHRLGAGSLDNAYYSSDTGLGKGTGWLYVCGNGGTAGAMANFAILQRIAVTNGTLGAALDSTQFVASNASARCDSITEFYNATSAVDYLFFAVEASGATGTACVGNGCVYAVTVTNGTLTAPPAAGTGAVNASGGTSGIIVDNNSSSTGAASIYFTWLVNGDGTGTYPCNGATTTLVCAVKLTQAGLQ
jgi:hypothetical protein